MGTEENDDDVDVVALARKTAKAGRAAVRQERRAAREPDPDEDRGVRRRTIVDGVPQSVVDAAVAQMERAGVRVDMRRIKKLDTGRFEVDLS